MTSPWEMSRRAFLQRSLLAASALSLPAAVLPGCRGAYEEDVPPDLVLATLKPWEFVVLHAAATRMLDGAPEADPTVVVQRADAALARTNDPFVEQGVSLVLRVVEYSTPLRGHVRPFSALAAPAQDAVLAGLAASRFLTLRVAFATVKLLAYFFHYTQDATWPSLGYQGPWVGRVPLPPYRIDYGLRNDEPFSSGSTPFPRR